MEAPLRFIQFPRETYPQPDGLLDVCFPIHDGDSRRWLRLNVVGVDAATYRSWFSEHYESAWAPVHDALAAMIDSGRAPDVTAVTITADGTILSTSSDASTDVTPGTYYAPPDDYQLPGHCKFELIPRNHLVEVDRLCSFTDLVTPVSSPSERLVFKHYEDGGRLITDVWLSIQILAGMSGYPHLVPIRHLVLHEHSGGVVGFTMPFIPGGDLQATRVSRTFKLKWAKQLFEALDHLNLEHGIDHRDVRLRNLVVDPATDNLIIIDLGKARRCGHFGGTCIPPTSYSPLSFAFQPIPTTLGTAAAEVEGGEEEEEEEEEKAAAANIDISTDPAAEVEEGGEEEEEEKAAAANIDISTNPDVNAAIVMVHELVTRSPTDHAWVTKEHGLWNGRGIDAITTGPWTAHPDARLDSPAEAYHAALVDWLRRRRADPRCRAAAAPLDFPDYMPIPQGDTVRILNYDDPLWPYYKSPLGTTSSVKVSGHQFLRRDAVRAGRPVVDWTRPAATALDPARTLLATGRYADEGKD
ncbi:hypothetical protein B0T25DRAFT_571138 [Lasiosphaeria hispida]|uniref:EKC/KEOPS complex subunit BUD32 n=1 Tax=Lasiosphaeria hispida TaxID=260671 RepID=A0AAJ0MA75_9PEZI|nr:hypothetical protein B0T25DRAFT_571138 [Lasiosphaeria hispida]